MTPDTHILIDCCSRSKRYLLLVSRCIGVTSNMASNHEASQHFVHHRVDVVLYYAKNIETRQNRFGKLDVLLERYRWVVASANWIGCCDNGTSCLQGSDNARFGNRDGLLLHRLVNRRSVMIVHLVKLVDQAYTLVCEHESPTLESPFTSHRILSDRRRKTNGRCTLTSCEHTTVCRLFDILEKLGLGRSRVTEHKDVDISTDTMFAFDIFRNAAEK